MKLTTKLIFFITAGFILILIVDSFFLISREKEIIENDRRQSQIEFIDNILPLLRENTPIRHFSTLDISTLEESTGDLNKYTFHEMNYWVINSPENSAILFLDNVNQKLYKYKLPSNNNFSLSDIYQRTAIVIILTILVAVLITYLVGQHVIGKPVNLILNKIKNIKLKNYDQHLHLNGNDEFACIAHSLNDLAAEIDLAYQTIEKENTEKLEYLNQLRHADRLTTIGVLASGIAHELGTPLNVILGHCSLIKSNLKNKKIESSLNTIHKQVDKMSNLIRNLLSFSQKTKLNKSRNCIHKVIENCIELLNHKLRKKNIEVKLDLVKTAWISCDVQKLEQVFLNIVLNSIHVLDENGVIKIVCKQKVEKTFKKETLEFYMISIFDNGPGIEFENLGKIFDPFFTTKDVGEGTGLGLSIAMGIVEEHNGWIEIESTPGEGTFFYIYLPVSIEEIP